VRRFWHCLPLILLAATAGAQVPAAPAAGDNVAVDPIRCWWRTDAGGVRIGQLFNVTLTCAALENDAVQVLVDESRLGATAVQLPPFEVVGGSHPADLRSGARRFFQYHYQIRVINPDVIGKDIGLPPVAIHYSINNRLNTSASVQGRDLVYLMPMLPIRIESLVATDATDIRDSAGQDFSNVERFLLRANALEIIAYTCVALGALMIVIVLVSIARRARTRTPVGERVLGIGALVDTAARELSAVTRDREAGGWSEALVARALAATRVTATAAIGNTISQRIVADPSAGDGRLVAPGGFRGKARIVSGSATTFDIDRALKNASGQAPLLESLRDAMTVFGSANYGRGGALDQTKLDEALAAARTATSQVRSEHSWLKTTLRQWRAGGPAPAVSRA
jgi:hypothetical protein